MGYRIKELRVERNITQEELAKTSGVSRGTIAALENSVDRSVLGTTLVKLADALGVPIDDLFYRQNAQPAKQEE